MTLGFVTIDEIEYNIPVIESPRTVNTLDKYAERTQDGVLHRQIIGVYVNYKVSFAKPTTMDAIAEYALLWNAISAPVEFHDVIMPDGYAFTCYIGDGVSDTVRRIWNATVFWKNLVVSFIAKSPSAVP